MRNKLWLASLAILLCGLLLFTAGAVYVTDPFIHYHHPHPEMEYHLNNERSQNDGIMKHFSYDGVITGTSMTENFKTSQADELFGAAFVKVPFSGGSYKELHDNLEVGFAHNDDIRIVIRALDNTRFSDDPDTMREDLGEFPTYLYDDNLLNDVYYVFNKDVLFNRTLPMLKAWRTSGWGYITPFDDYADFGGLNQGAQYILPEEPFTAPEAQLPMTEEIRSAVLANLQQNVISSVASHPDTEFYFFFPPYSAKYHADLWEAGTLKIDIESQKLVLEALLPYPNVKFFSFNLMTDIITNLDYYSDRLHYDAGISERILQYMHDGVGLLTLDNYQEYIDRCWDFYSGFDYNSLYDQIPEGVR